MDPLAHFKPETRAWLEGAFEAPGHPDQVVEELLPTRFANVFGVQDRLRFRNFRALWQAAEWAKLSWSTGTPSLRAEAHGLVGPGGAPLILAQYFSAGGGIL